MDKSSAKRITNPAGFIQKADFIKFCQDEKLLDFTGRKIDLEIPGHKKSNENPNEKVLRVI